MIKKLRSAALALLAAAAAASVTPAAAFTQTNVLQNVNVTFTIYQQGTVSSTGRKLPDKVTSFTTKNLLAALEDVTGINFGAGAKLVQSTVFASETIATGAPVYSNAVSTNLAVATNVGYLNVGGPSGANLYGFNFTNPAGGLLVLVISNSTFISNYDGTLTTNIVSNIGGPTTNSVAIDTNGGLTILTPSLNGSGQLTNVLVFTEQLVSNAPTTNVFTNVSSTLNVLYGGTANNLYPLTNYIEFFTNSAEVVTESGLGLDTTNGVVTSQSGFSISNMLVSYFSTDSADNLNIYLTGFVKQSLKIDTLSGRGATAVSEDIFGASATWNVIGSGYSGGGFIASSTDPTAVFVTNYVDGNFVAGYLTNTTPVVVQGTVSISFLKNLPQ
jgi:hypothetical protein